MKTIIVTHASKLMFGKVVKCPDAVAAVWAYLHTHPTISLEDLEIIWQPYLSADAYEKFKVPFEYEGRDVLFFDFCYPEHIMKEIANKCKTLTALDHHEPRKNVLENLETFSRKALGRYGDEQFCGATLVWNNYTTEPLPWFMIKVWERDTGANGYYEGEILKSESFNTWLAKQRQGKSLQEVMDLYDSLYDLKEPTPKMEDIKNLEQRETLCKEVASLWESNRTYIKLKGYIVPFIKIKNKKCDKYYSHAGRHLKDYTDYPFVVIQCSGDSKAFHLRASKESPIHVGYFCEELGGGGHRRAGGFDSGKDKFFYITPTLKVIGKISDTK